MKNSKIIFTAFLNSLGVTAYITFVSMIIRNGEKLFGKMENFLGPVVFLLLFVLSATITGTLILGRPILWYLEGKKSEAVKLLFYTIGWLLAATLLALFAQILRK
jgi:hypothetical protein